MLSTKNGDIMIDDEEKKDIAQEKLDRIAELYTMKVKKIEEIDLSRFSKMTEEEVFSLIADDCSVKEINYFVHNTPQLDELDEQIVNLYFLGSLTYEEIAEITNYDKQSVFRRRDKLTLRLRCTVWRLSHPGEKISSETILNAINDKLLKHRRRHKKQTQ